VSQWLAALPALLVAGLLCVVPGYLAGWLIGLRGIAVLGVAGPIGVTVLGVGAICCELLGLPWGLLGVVVSMVAGGCVAALVGLALRRAPAAWAAVHRDDRRLVGWGWSAAVAGLVAVSVPAMWGMGRPDRLPHQPDTLFHLNTIQLMRDTGDASSLNGAALNSATRSGFYPAAFHDIAVAVVSITGADVRVAANATALVAASVIWTTGCVLLARQVFGPSRLALLFAALVSGSFSSFPFWLMGYGVLWPNLLGYALIPAWLACIVGVLGLAKADVVGRSSGVVAALALLIGLALSHPNALISAVLFAFLIAAWPLSTWLRRSWRGRPVLSGLVVLGYLAVPVLWVLGPYVVSRVAAVASRNTVVNETTPARAFGEAVLHSPRGWPEQWTVSVLAIAGLVVLLRQRRTAWVGALLTVGTGLYVVAMAFRGGLGSAVTGYWYNNSPRLMALLPIVGVVLVTAALVAASRWLQGNGKGWRRWAAPLAVAVVFVGVTSGNYVAESAARIRTYYHPTSLTGNLLSQREAESLEELARLIPPNAVVADDPWNGTSLIYALSGRRVLFPTEKTLNTADRVLLADKLYLASSDPAVCEAVERQGVQYVLTGGSPFQKGRHGERTFDGVDKVSNAPGFDRLASSGPFDLYRITACQ
jgi:uncharacterized protein DUF6541